MIAFLPISGQILQFTVGADAPQPVHDLVARIAEPSAVARPTTHLEIHGAERPKLAVDTTSRRVVLQVPPADAVRGGAVTVQIAVLQTTARCLALMASEAFPLLHGGAITLDCGRSAVAVLDGGRGQGKTSLALGLARRGGHVLIDEFPFAVFGSEGPAVVPVPSFPWHVRPDMTEVLAPGRAGRLLYPDDLGSVVHRSHRPIPLRSILIPDSTIPVGQVREVDQGSRRDLLYSAVTDHEAKLRTPALDHVSLFTRSDEVAISDAPGSPAWIDHTLERLTALPVARVGIGRPQHLPAAVAAALIHLGYEV